MTSSSGRRSSIGAGSSSGSSGQKPLWSGAWFVMWIRAGDLPVMIDARVGEQTGAAA